MESYEYLVCASPPQRGKSQRAEIPGGAAMPTSDDIAVERPCGRRLGILDAHSTPCGSEERKGLMGIDTAVSPRIADISTPDPSKRRWPPKLPAQGYRFPAPARPQDCGLPTGCGLPRTIPPRAATGPLRELL